MKSAAEGETGTITFQLGTVVPSDGVELFGSGGCAPLGDQLVAERSAWIAAEHSACCFRSKAASLYLPCA